LAGAATGLVMSAAPILSTRGLTKHFRGLTAMSAVDIDVPEGAICSLIGPNGAGKSTFFNLVTGYAAPSAGSITFAGQRIDVLPTDAINRLGIGRAFQISKPFPGLSVHDNVRVGALFGADGPRDPEAVTADALALAGLAAHRDATASSLTIGFLRRLELARAIATRPRLLLADEPCAGLNPTETAEIVAILRRVRAGGITVLLVEQNAQMALGIANRAYVLETGKITMAGDAKEMLHDEKVISAYLGL